MASGRCVARTVTDLLLDPANAALSAAWFWSINNVNSLADAGNFTGITQRINGGQNDAADRLNFYNTAQQVPA